MESGKYRNESIKTRVRPIKKLCIIENNDFPRLIEIIRIYSKEICGILNLILINDATLFSSNILEFIKSHDPDIIINYSSCVNEKLMEKFDIKVLNGNSKDFSLEYLSYSISHLSNELDPYAPLRKGNANLIFTNIDENPNIEKMFFYLNFGMIDQNLADGLKDTIFKDITHLRQIPN